MDEFSEQFDTDITEDFNTYYQDYNLPAGNDTNATKEFWDPWHPPYAIRVNRSFYSMAAIYMSFLFAISFPLNSIVLYTYVKNRCLQTPVNYIIANLIVADLLSVFFSCAVGITTNVAGCFFLGKWMCIMEGFCASVAGVTGLMSVSVMAFERYFVICKPIGPVRFTEKHAVIGILFTWIYSVGWHVVPLFWDGYEAEGLGTTCAPNYFVTDPGPRLFIVLYFVFCFVVPFSAIGLSYGKLILTLRQMSKESMVSGSSNVSADQEVTKMVVLMVSAFCFCWFPYAIISMITVFSVEKNYGLGAIPAFFAKSAAIYNPLIYIGLNRQFRDCTIKVIFNGKNPWSDEVSGPSSVVSTAGNLNNKVAPA